VRLPQGRAWLGVPRSLPRLELPASRSSGVNITAVWLAMLFDYQSFWPT